MGLIGKLPRLLCSMREIAQQLPFRRYGKRERESEKGEGLVEEVSTSALEVCPQRGQEM